MSRYSSRVLTVVLIGLSLIFSVHLIDRWLSPVAVDLTSENLYSLSPGTRSLLRRMSDEGIAPVDVKLYFSETTGKTLPAFIKDFLTYERYVRSLLREYEQASGGRLRLEVIDPVPDSDEAQEAAELGLDGKMINQEGDLFFFGVAFETQTGARETIEFLWPQEQESIEYELSKTLYRLLWPESQRVGVLSSLEVFGSAQDPFMAQMLAAQGRRPTEEWLSIRAMRELYSVEPIPADTDSISADDYDVVVVIHPKDLPTKTLAALDEWVVRGGDTLILVDPYSIVDQAPQNPQQPWAALQYQPASDLEPLFEAWGIERLADQFVADLELAVTRPVGPTSPAESVVVDLLIDESSAEQTLASGQPVVEGLSNLRFLLAGALRVTGANGEAGEDEDDASEEDAPSPSSGLEVEPLVTTTEEGALITVQPGFGGGEGLAYADFNNPTALRDALRPTGRQALAYVLRGRFPSAYPDGVEYPDREAERPPNLPPGIELPPPEDAEMIRREPVTEEDRAEAAVIVFADVDFIADALAFQQPFPGLVQASNDNHRLLLNAVDFLLGAEELRSIRTAKRLTRPFQLFDEIENQAERDTLEREQAIRAEIDQFEDELRAKQGEITSRNAALFQKQLQDEVDSLNARIQESNAQLREIRKGRREAIEAAESRVRFAVMGWMPILILAIGLFLGWRRRSGAAPVQTGGKES